jgi:protein involved in polysaccharide export with SLBB domain
MTRARHSRAAPILLLLSILLVCLPVLPVTAQTAAQASSTPKSAVAAPQSGSPDMSQLPGMSSYQVGPGDVIGLRVFDEPDFSLPNVRLNDAGTISLPIVGEISVLGRTVSEIERLVNDRLRGRVLVNPIVNVSLLQYRTFFVQGQVRGPGTFAFMPGLTVRKAAILAGGFTERASMKKIYVIRDKDPAQKQLQADLNTEIGPGDLIFIGETFF